MPWLVVGSMVPPLDVKLPLLFVRTIPLAPPLDETLSKVTAIELFPPLRLTPTPAVLATETLATVNAPTLAPLMPVPVLVLTFSPRTVLSAASVILATAGRAAAAIERLGASVNPTPWPISGWFFSSVKPPLYAPEP